MYQKLLIQPLLTEKMAIMQERENKYAFIVDKSANKNQIKEAMEYHYKLWEWIEFFLSYYQLCLSILTISAQCFQVLISDT